MRLNPRVQIQAVVLSPQSLPNSGHEDRSMNDLSMLYERRLAKLTALDPAFDDLCPDGNLALEHLVVIKLDQFGKARALSDEKPHDFLRFFVSGKAPIHFSKRRAQHLTGWRIRRRRAFGEICPCRNDDSPQNGAKQIRLAFEIKMRQAFGYAGADRYVLEARPGVPAQRELFKCSIQDFALALLRLEPAPRRRRLPRPTSHRLFPHETLMPEIRPILTVWFTSQ